MFIPYISVLNMCFSQGRLLNVSLMYGRQIYYFHVLYSLRDEKSMNLLVSVYLIIKYLIVQANSVLLLMFGMLKLVY